MVPVLSNKELRFYELQKHLELLYLQCMWLSCVWGCETGLKSLELFFPLLLSPYLPSEEDHCKSQVNIQVTTQKFDEYLCIFSTLQCRRILDTRVHIFVLGRHLGFGNCGGLGQGKISIQDGGIESLDNRRFR